VGNIDYSGGEEESYGEAAYYNTGDKLLSADRLHSESERGDKVAKRTRRLEHRLEAWARGGVVDYIQ
jgi:hypothetical protein